MLLSCSPMTYISTCPYIPVCQHKTLEAINQHIQKQQQERKISFYVVLLLFYFILSLRVIKKPVLISPILSRGSRRNFHCLSKSLITIFIFSKSHTTKWEWDKNNPILSFFCCFGFFLFCLVGFLQNCDHKVLYKKTVSEIQLCRFFLNIIS